jgi:hypothetical protein
MVPRVPEPAPRELPCGSSDSTPGDAHERRHRMTQPGRKARSPKATRSNRRLDLRAAGGGPCCMCRGSRKSARRRAGESARAALDLARRHLVGIICHLLDRFASPTGGRPAFHGHVLSLLGRRPKPLRIQKCLIQRFLKMEHRNGYGTPRRAVRSPGLPGREPPARTARYASAW